MQGVCARRGSLVIFLSFSTVVLLGALYAGYAPTYISGHFRLSGGKILLVIIVIAHIAVALLPCKKEEIGSEPYGNFHRALNEVPGHEALTEWVNMGYWTVSKRTRLLTSKALRAGRYCAVG
jgi:hypothetical protein